MRVVIFGGTTEGRQMSEKLSRWGIEVQIFVATEYGREEQGEIRGVKVCTGRKDKNQIKEAVRNADICIDATHPYAEMVTEYVSEACCEEHIPYYRLKRSESGFDENGSCVFVNSAEEAAQWLKNEEGNILLTTGSKDLKNYADLEKTRLYPRVLPVFDSIRACEEIGVPHRNIVAMQGPFSQEMNEAFIRQLDIKFLVTKDGGKAGGFDEKIKAAKKCGIQTVIIKRPKEYEGESFSFEEICEICRREICR